MIKILSIAIAISTMLLTGCAGIIKDQSDSYSVDQNRYLIAQMSCITHDKHTATVPQSDGTSIKLEFAAGNCDRIQQPEHGLKYTAQVAGDILNTVGILGGAVIAGEYQQSAARTSSDAAVRIAELNNETNIAEQQTLREFIESNSQLIELQQQQIEAPTDGG